jgi:glycosyltransferase involved in cell wall biosynthesis
LSGAIIKFLRLDSFCLFPVEIMKDQQINVLYLTNNPNRGSTSRPTEGWLTYLYPHKLRPVVASDRSGSFQQWIGERGIPSYEIPLPNPDKLRPLPFLLSLWKLRALIKRHDIQLIHCIEQNVYPIGKYLSRLTSVPIVVTAQYTLGREFSEWAFAGKPKPSRLFFVSEGNREASRLAVRGLVSEKSWRLLYNSVDPNDFSPDHSLGQNFRKEHGIVDDVLIGTASALRPRKQLEHMFQAALNVKQSSITKFKFVLAGSEVSGDEAYASDLLASAKEMLGEHLIVLGHLEDLRGLYNALDLYLHTSQEEGCSLSILEAMSVGCPVLGYKSIGADEQVLPGGGEIVEQDNIDLLSEALKRWISSESLRSKTRSLARQRVLDKFNSEKVSEILFSEYQSVLDS